MRDLSRKVYIRKKQALPVRILDQSYVRPYMQGYQIAMRLRNRLPPLQGWSLSNRVRIDQLDMMDHILIY